MSDGSLPEQMREMAATQRGALEALARAAEYRDDSTGGHPRRVGDLSAAIARKLGMPSADVEAIRLAAPLHDVGKVSVPDAILLKPGLLDDEELAVMRRHTIVGAEVLATTECPLMRLARDIALCHHERWDGFGYPNGRMGEAIPIAARIVAIADVYDALVHLRPYKRAWSHERAVEEIRRQAGKQFDPRVVDAFCRI